MKKQLRIIRCFITILAIVTLAACRDISPDGFNSSEQNGTSTLYENSQTAEVSSETDNAPTVSDGSAQVKSSYTSGNTVSAAKPDTSKTSDSRGSNASVNSTTESTVSDTKPNTSVSSNHYTEKPANNTSSATSTPSSVHTHSYSSKKIAATCTQDGHTLKTCDCGHSKKTEQVSALGHSWSDWITVKEATETSTGLQRRTCIQCGENEEQVLEKIPQSDNNLQLEILRLVNEERAKHGLNALQYYYAGQSAADIRAVEIDTVFSHTRPNGTSCFTVLDELGIKYRGAGENIAKGQPTAQAVMQGWMNSQGHRENILNPNFTHLIVGANDRCWVQLFLTI